MDTLPRPARYLVMEGYFDVEHFIHQSQDQIEFKCNVLKRMSEKCTLYNSSYVRQILGEVNRAYIKIKNDVRDYKGGEIQFDDDV